MKKDVLWVLLLTLSSALYFSAPAPEPAPLQRTTERMEDFVPYYPPPARLKPLWSGWVLVVRVKGEVFTVNSDETPKRVIASRFLKRRNGGEFVESLGRAKIRTSAGLVLELGEATLLEVRPHAAVLHWGSLTVRGRELVTDAGAVPVETPAGEFLVERSGTAEFVTQGDNLEIYALEGRVWSDGFWLEEGEAWVTPLRKEP